MNTISNSRKVFILILVAIVAASAYFYFFKGPTGQDGNVASASYINERGEKWEIPKGNFDFQVSSGEGYPKFVSGSIDPLDVKVGDIQKMKIEVDGNTPVSRVWAEIETDNGIKKVELKLVSISAVASPVARYQFEGEWTVADTHTETYHTKFIAEDSSKNSDSMTLAWSDPACNFPGGVLQEASCTPVSSEVVGAEGTDISLNGKTITLANANSILTFNPGYKIVIGTGHINIGSGSIRQGVMYYNDVDGDGYAASAGPVFRASSSGEDQYGRLDGNKIRVGRSADFGPSTISRNSGTVTSIALLDNQNKLAEKSKFRLIPVAEARPPCELQDECYFGPTPPSPTPAVAWSNPTNAQGGINGTYASAAIATNNSTQWLGLTNFGFSAAQLPDYAKINGISVTVRGYKTGTAADNLKARMIYYDSELGQTISTTNSVINSINTWNSASDQVFGSTSSNSWSIGFTPAMVRGSGFGVDISIPTGGATTINVDSVTVNVGFTVPGVKGTNDCADASPTPNADGVSSFDARPGQTLWFYSPVPGTGSFDYNCDGVSTKQTTNLAGGNCDFLAYNNRNKNSLLATIYSWVISPVFARPPGEGPTCTPGWDGYAPACGATNNYYYYVETFENRKMSCH